jgi:2-methylcitrate dehydratase PrpD
MSGVAEERRMSTADGIAAWVTALRYDDLPATVVEVTKRAYLDTIGVILAGADEPVTRAVHAFLADEGARPAASQLGTRFKTSMAGAALVNGASGHALDYDDVSLSCLGHPSAVLAPAVLAAAEATGASGRAVVEAYVAGYEVMTKLGLAVGIGHYRLGWHATATLGTLGAAMAAGKVFGLDARRLAHALAAAVSMASGSRRNFGTMIKPLHPGHAARCGIEAARLAQCGLEGDREIMEAPYGFFDLFTRDGVDAGGFATRLGNPWDLVTPGLNVKRYPCCYNTHRAADATLALAEQVSAGEVAAARVTVPVGGMLPLIHPRPRTGLEGKFSMEYVVAAGLLDRSLTLKTFHDAAVQRPEAQDLLRRVTVVEDPDIKVVQNPVDEGHVEVALTTRDGRQLLQRVTFPVGSSEVPLSWPDLVAKFRDCADGILDGRRAERVIDVVATLESQATLSELMAALTPA